MKVSHKVLGIVVVLIVVVLIVLQWPSKTNKLSNLSEAPKGGDFTLDTATGPFDLKSQRGKVVLIYFGYTFCPDICPTNLMLIAQAFNALSKDELARVQGVFISVDPERDTLDRLAAYTKYFHPSIIGATGKPDHIAKIAKQYGAVYRKVEGESEGGYLIDHSANTYVVAPDGSLNTILPHATPPEDIVKVIRSLLDKTGTQ
ncbi:MAG: redoxin domain-containing protein [Gammaproteobacteria bacterium]|nr:redoxin domain-containing protein [Gammaproteobacteria bacterium]